MNRFNAQTLDNDIALIRLNEVVKFTPRIHPICLVSASGGNFVGKQANVAGWGTQNRGGSPVNKLRNTNVTVMYVFQFF